MFNVSALLSQKSSRFQLLLWRQWYFIR